MKKVGITLLGLCFLGLLIVMPEPISAQATLPMEIQLKIKKDHWHNSHHASYSPRFLPTMTMRKLDDLVKVALKSGTTILEKSGRHVHHYTFPKSIGYSYYGNRSYSLKVVTDNEGNIITAHPV